MLLFREACYSLPLVVVLRKWSRTYNNNIPLRTHTVSLTLRTHTVSEDTHCLTVSEDKHCLWGHTLSHWLWGQTLSHCLWGHTLSLRTHTVSLSLRTHTVSLTLRTDTVSLSLRTHTDSEDTHCVGNLWHHYSIKTHGPIFRKLTECIWCFGDRMSLERLRCTGWVRDQLNQPDVDLNFPYPSLSGECAPHNSGESLWSVGGASIRVDLQLNLEQVSRSSEVTMVIYLVKKWTSFVGLKN